MKNNQIYKVLSLILAAAITVTSVNMDAMAATDKMAGQEMIETDADSEDAVEDETDDVLSSDDELAESVDDVVEDEFYAVEENNIVAATGYRALPEEHNVASVYDYAIDADYVEDYTEAEFPSKYETAYLPPLRNQNPYGSCWAHATLANAEINAMQKGIRFNPDYSEIHLAYFTYEKNKVDPLGGTEGDSNKGVYDADSPNFLDRGGNYQFSTHTLTSWVGAVDEIEAPYSSAKYYIANGLNQDSAYTLDNLHLMNVRYVSADDRATMKKLLMEYGALGVDYYAILPGEVWTINGSKVSYSDVYSSANNCYYFPVTVYDTFTNHAVTVVGWDDNFSASKFKVRPEGDGAWLIRNSWTTVDNTKGYDGYFWMSYYDKSLTSAAAYAFDFEESTNYDNNYQYDGSFVSAQYRRNDNATMANVFKASACDAGETLKAVAFSTVDTNINYTVKIYTGFSGVSRVTNPTGHNSRMVSSVSGTTTTAGYYTVKLDSPVSLNKGDIYSVVVELEKNGTEIHPVIEASTQSDWFQSVSKSESGQSFLAYGTSWSDIGSGGRSNLRIRAYTSNKEDVSASKVTVSFDPGEGTVYPSSKTVEVGKAYGTLPTPTRTGYTFDGWYTGKTGGSEVTSSTEVENSANHTLYAHWSVKDINVSFDANGGSVSTASRNYKYGSEYGKLPVPTRTNYTFLGWYTSKTGGSLVTDNTIVTQSDDYTLYAHWQGKEMLLTFDPRGGEVSPTSKTVYYKSPYGELPTPTKTGSRFVGWCPSEDGGEVIESDTVVNETQDHTLYAFWSMIRYTVSFNKNGGTGDCPNKEVLYGKSYGSLPIPTKAGYVFDGWYTSLSGGKKITEDSTMETASNHTLYAHWNKNVTVTFNPNGGSVSPTSMVVASNCAYGTLPSPTREGYRFDGWYTSLTGGTEVTHLTIVEGTSNRTLYAHWTGNAVTVRYNANGGACSDAYGTWCDSFNVSKTVGDKYGTLPVALRTGYTLKGWFTSAEGGEQITADTVITQPTNHTIYAQWIKDAAATVTVTYNANGGTCATPSAPKTVGDMYSPLPKATRDGYSFIGWFTSAEGGTQVINSTTVEKTTDHTLYAHWSGNVISVSFDVNGGTDTIPSQLKRVGDAYGTLPAPTREGYTFAGWYTSAAGGDLITNETAITKTLGHTIYAHWTGNTITVTYDPNGGTCDILNESKRVGDLYATLPRPAARAGYTFNGWYTSPAGGSIVTDDMTIEITESHTLYARWTGNNITVTYNANGGVCDKTSEKKRVGDLYAPLPSATKSGYTFAGWYTSAEGGVRITNDTAITKTYSHTIYAQWIQNEPGDPNIPDEPEELKWGEVSDDDRDEMGYTTPEDIPEGLWMAGVPDEIDYCGKAITFDTLHIYNNNRLLTVNTDYTIKYNDNTNAGTGIITVTGKGNYEGTLKKYFTIVPLDLEDSDKVTVVDVTLPYNKKTQYGNVSVFYDMSEDSEEESPRNMQLLKKGKDYTLCYYYEEGNVLKEPGEYDILVTGIGNYTGECWTTQTILDPYDGTKSIDKLKFGTLPNMMATGEEVVVNNYINIFDKEYDWFLDEGIDYSVDYVNNILPGTASVIITGMGEYAGTKILTFKISAIPISKAVVEGIENKTYTGAAQYQDQILLSYKENKNAPIEYLTEGTDYVIELCDYSNNINAGSNKASFVVKGKGRFSGTLKKTFTIYAKDIGEIEPDDFDDELCYQKGGVKPALVIKDNGIVLKEGVDYTVSYANNKAITYDSRKIPGVTVKGKGNYSGTFTKQFIIKQSSLDNVTVEAADIVYSGKANALSPKLTILDSDGTKLAIGTDIEKTPVSITYYKAEKVTQYDKATKVYYSYDRAAGEDVNPNDIIPAGAQIKVVVRGKGNYNPDSYASAVLRCVQYDIAKATVAIKPQRYISATKKVELTADDITVKMKGVSDELVLGVDYEIAGYDGNDKKGNAKVTIKGKDGTDYGGVKTVTFKILGKSFFDFFW